MRSLPVSFHKTAIGAGKIIMLVIVVAGLFLNRAHAQATEKKASNKEVIVEPCGYSGYKQKLLAEHPEMRIMENNLEEALLKTRLERKVGQVSPLTVLSIPVVVHVIYDPADANPGTGTNISDDQVLLGLQQLNDAFRNRNYYDPADGADVEVEFCLAQRDPNGNFTTGITRNASALTNMTMEADDATLKAIQPWNSLNYLNIWVVNEINSTVHGLGVEGYSTFPASHGTALDGIVNEARAFGLSPDGTSTLVHEVGHYLGLLHTFEGGCVNNNCLTDNDKVCDTPPDGSQANFLCSNSVNSCTSDVDDHSVNNPFRPVANGGIGDQNDAINNYMDYGLYTCKKAFTPGQVTRMRTFLTTTRQSLLNSLGCQTLCPNPVAIAFTLNANSISVGQSIAITNTSTNLAGYVYSWFDNGVLFANVYAPPAHTINSQGIHKIELVISNGNIACERKLKQVVQVNCLLNGTFTASATTIAPGGNITFTNTTPGIANNNIQWLVDNVAIGAGSPLNHVFNLIGPYRVQMVVFDGTCYDTSEVMIRVGACITHESDQWYFAGNAGVSFITGTPVPFNGSAMSTPEGSSSIADVNGQTLFYTNGATIWNRNNVPMNNHNTGAPAVLLGNTSATQSTVIVKQPGACNLYYVFTNGGYEDGAAGTLMYSIVDMNMNGGLGEVSVLNVPLYATTTEALIAVKHDNNFYVWIVSHEWGNNNYRAYLLSETGLNLTPVISSIGTSCNSANTLGKIGAMKASISGTMIAYTISWPINILQVCRFNKLTGSLSQPFFTTPTSGGYGLEFSPNERFLYFNSGAAALYQIDLSTGIQANISASQVQIALRGGTGFGVTFQMGPDGRIYIPMYNTTSIGAIRSPNLKGAACDFAEGVIALPAGQSTGFGLPNNISGMFGPEKTPIGGRRSVCVGSTETYTIVPCNGGVYSWRYGAHKGTIVDTKATTLTITFNKIGRDTIIIRKDAACGFSQDTAFIDISPEPIIDLNDRLLCTGQMIALDAGTGYATYKWTPGNLATQVVNVNATGNYTITVTSAMGCTATDVVTVSADPNCCGGGPNLTQADFTGTHTYTGQSYNLQNSVTVSGTDQITFNNCDINIAPAIKITLSTNSKLTFNNCHLHACSNLWDGIYVISSSSEVIVNNNSLIEDATNAIVSNNGGKFTVNTAIFNKDVIGIQVNTFANNHAGTVINSVFTSRVLFGNNVWPTVAALKAAAAPAPAMAVNGYAKAMIIGNYSDPMNNPEKRMHHCIELNNVGSASVNYSGYPPVVTSTGGIVIGDAVNAPNTNLFDNANFGVYVNKSNVTVKNNQFQYLNMYATLCATDPNGVSTCPNPYGFGVYGVAVNGGNTAWIGSANQYPCTSPADKNVFYECGAAVSLTDFAGVSIYANQVINTTNLNSGMNPPAVGGGISSTSSNNGFTNILYNQLTNVLTGIGVTKSWYSVQSGSNYTMTSYQGPLVIDQNTFTGNAQSTDMVVTGISFVSNDQPTCTNCTIGAYNYVNKVDISGNTFNGVTNGIRVDKFQGQTSVPCTIGSNTINFKSNAGTGISLNLVGYANVNFNSISGLIGVSYSGKTAWRGIYEKSCIAYTLQCNSISRVGVCMFFDGVSSPAGGTTVQGNSLNLANDGMFFNNGARVGTQGSNTYSNGNTWGIPSNFLRSQTYIQQGTSTAAPDVFWVRQGTNQDFTLWGGSPLMKPSYISGTSSYSCSPTSSLNPCPGNRFEQQPENVQAGQDITMRVYPNPSSGEMQLDYRLEEGQRGELVILDMLGQKVSSYKLTNAANTLHMDESHLKSGIYFYSVIVNDEVVKTSKLSIVH